MRGPCDSGLWPEQEMEQLYSNYNQVSLGLRTRCPKSDYRDQLYYLTHPIIDAKLPIVPLKSSARLTIKILKTRVCRPYQISK
jgi:hypothetical protein